MDEPPSTSQYRPRRLAALCGAALAAALFTPVPATARADAAQRQPVVTSVRVSTVHTTAPSADKIADSLISTGMIGIGLALGGLVIVTHRRRQW